MPETLRSAGARVVLTIGFYKHLAPLEPEPILPMTRWTIWVKLQAEIRHHGPAVPVKSQTV